MKKNSKLIKVLSCVLAVVLLVGCSFAYFTDYATTQANGTAGTVALSMDNNINLLDAEGRDIINPGDKRDGSFTVTNEGNKSIDVRTTIVLTGQSNTGFDLEFSGDANTQSEYDLYLKDDVELVEGQGYKPKTGAKPLQVKSVNQDTITYILPEYMLNGNSDKYNEVETIDGVTEFAHTYDIVFVMKGEADNKWQDSSVSIDVLVEAKQHENTQAGWEIVAKENVVSGAINQEAVKGENVISSPDGQANGTITFSLRDGSLNGIENVTMKLVKLPDSTVSVVDTLGGTVIKTVRSDENGEGEFTGLELGNYALVSPNFILTAEAESLAILQNNDIDHYEYIGDLDWASSVGGTIVDSLGNPIVGEDVSLKDENNEFVAAGKTDENGNFTIYPAVDGDYTLDLGTEAIPNIDAAVNGGDVTLDNITVPIHTLLSGPEFNAVIPEGVRVIRFESTPIPEGAETIRVDGFDLMGAFTNGKIYAYQEGDEFIVTTGNGRTIYANLDSYDMFKNIDSIEEIYFDNFNTQKMSSASSMFAYCDGLTEMDLSSWNIVNSGYITMQSLFDGCANLTDVTLPATTGNIQVRYMFYNCKNLETVDASQFKPTKWGSASTTSSKMFYGCSSLKNVNLVLNTSGESSPVLSFEDMFYGCTSLETLDMTGWDLTNVYNVNSMFEGCTSLKTIKNSGNIKINNVKDMGMMFAKCSALTTLDLSWWNPASVTTASGMFSGCSNLSAIYSLTSSQWQANTTANGSSMFAGCDKLPNYDSTKTDWSMAKTAGGYFSEPW